MWELRISANASPYRFLGLSINSTLNILSARGLAHSERQRNVTNVTLRNTELHSTKKAISFTTPKITFIKHPEKEVLLPCCEPILFCEFGAQNRVQFAWANVVVPPLTECFLPQDLLCRCAGHVEAGREQGSCCLPLAPAKAAALGSLRVVPVRRPAIRLSLVGPCGVSLGLLALRWFGVCGPGYSCVRLPVPSTSQWATRPVHRGCLVWTPTPPLSVIKTRERMARASHAWNPPRTPRCCTAAEEFSGFSPQQLISLPQNLLT